MRTNAIPGGATRNTTVRLKPGSAASADSKAAIADFMRDFMRDWIEQALKTQRISVESLV